MKIRKLNIHFAVIGIVTILFFSCNDRSKTNPEKIKNHGYNELSNPDSIKHITVSDYNSDNLEIKNISRPESSTIETQLDTTMLFGIWTMDPEGPHADFHLTGKSFYVADYDGDGDMPYELKGIEMKVYYNDFIQKGKIVSVDKDTLKIMWQDMENVSKYVRWTQ